MMQHIATFNHRFKLQFPWVICFAVAFAVLGYFVPLVYRQYFDETKYLYFTQPVQVREKVAKPCAKIHLSSSATTVMPLQLQSTTNLLKIEGQEQVGIAAWGETTSINKVEKQLYAKDFSLPCEISPGEYFFNGVIKYELDKTEKRYEWYSETFEVR